MKEGFYIVVLAWSQVNLEIWADRMLTCIKLHLIKHLEFQLLVIWPGGQYIHIYNAFTVIRFDVVVLCMYIRMKIL